MRPLAFFLAITMTATSLAEPLHWTQLPPIPDAEGFAGAFAGVSHGALIVAGGANITGDKWREPFVKKWYDSTWILERPEGPWKSGLKLPRPLGYGVSVTVDDALVCLGGSDEKEHSEEVFRLEWIGGELRKTAWPSLPRPCANFCGVLIGRTIYLAGGIETPTATTALKSFWSLDVDHLDRGWRELEPWPGPERMLAVAGSVGGDFLLFSGASLSAGPDGKPLRRFLSDAYRYTPDRGWRRLADLPRPAVAAPTPAIPGPAETLLIVSGDDGRNVDFQPVIDHPSFPRDVLIYDAATDHWNTEPGAPISRATVPTTQWNGRWIIPNGEVRPRVRTPEVWVLEPR